MLDKITEGLKIAIKTLKGNGTISEANVKSTVKEIKKVLLQADVDYKVAKQFADEVRDKSLGLNIINDISPRELFIKVVHDELVALLGSHQTDLVFAGNPAVIMLVGLQGAGKTTLSVKLANFIQNKFKKTVLIAACDIYRPAAIEQLNILAASANIDVYSELNSKDVCLIADNALQNAKLNNKQVVLIDTAGRVAVNREMMDEITDLKRKVMPTETLFVVDAMMGQDGLLTAAAFNDNVNFDGVVLTKFDGDTKGGLALSIAKVLAKPIKFVSVGEKIEDLELFCPDRIVGRILGMGDIVSLVEKFENVFNKKETDKLEKRIKNNQFSFNDLFEQINTVKKLGNVRNILGMIPGLSSFKDSFDENVFEQARIIILSMTKYERENPSVFDKSRIDRISRGSGVSSLEVTSFLKRFESIRSKVRGMNSKKTSSDFLAKLKLN